jgi:hypothetical protein
MKSQRAYQCRTSMILLRIVYRGERSESRGECDERTMLVIESMALTFNSSDDRKVPDRLVRNALVLRRECNSILIDIACGIAFEDMGNGRQAIFMYNRPQCSVVLRHQLPVQIARWHFDS